jgi:hypothetical protein
MRMKPALSNIRALSPAARADRIRNHPVAGVVPQRLPANELASLIAFFESDQPQAIAVTDD